MLKSYWKRRDEAYAMSSLNPSKNTGIEDDSGLMQKLDSVHEMSKIAFIALQRNMQYSLKVLKNKKYTALMSDYGSREFIVYWNRPGLMFWKPGSMITVQDNFGTIEETIFCFDTGHKNQSQFSIRHKNDCLRLMHDDYVFYIPLCQNAEDYFQYQLMYPELLLTFEEIEQFLKDLSYCDIDSRKRVSFHSVRHMVYFAKILIKYPIIKLFRMDMKYFRDSSETE